MFWNLWFKEVFGEDQMVPTVDSAMFTCKLCGENHLATKFEHGVAHLPETITTERDGQKQWYFVCKRHSHESLQKEQEHTSKEQCGGGNDCCRNG